MITTDGLTEPMIKEKLLSICMMGRDDDYMPDFKYRIATVLNHFARNLNKIGRASEVELVITDWGSTLPMAQSIRLSPAAAEMCRFIYVAPEIILKTQGGKEYFHTNRAYNVPFSRAYGRFVMCVGADQLMLQPALDSLLRLLRGKTQLPVDIDNTFFAIPRQQVPWQFVHRQPSLEEWDQYLFLNEYNLGHEDSGLLHSFGGTAGFLAHKKIWYDLRGCDERLEGWGWSDIDLGYRATQKYPFLFLSCINVTMYHMGHQPAGRRESALQIQNQNPQIHNTSLQVNDSSWGLRDYSLEEMRAGNTLYLSVNTEYINNSSTDNDSILNKSINQIETDLQDPILAENVNKIVSLFTQSSWDFDSNDLYPIVFLHWYSKIFYPRNYIEYGFGRGYSSAVVAEACPSVNLFGVDFWEGIIPVKRPYFIPYFLDSLKFRGYIRFINGDMTTAFKRIQNSSITPIIFDLAFVRTHNLGGKAFDVISSIISSLSSDGALVFTCPTSDQYYSILERLKNLFPEKRYLRSNKNKTGVVLSSNSNVEDPLRTELDYAIASTPRKTQVLSSGLKPSGAPQLVQETENAKHTTTSVIPTDILNQPLSIEPYLKTIDVDKFRKMPVLLCYPGRRESWKSPIISENEIFCGPDCATVRGADGLKEIRINAGIYEIPLILSNIPKYKWPELYVVRPSLNNRPVNAATLLCPRVVIIGKDFYDPLQTNILAEYLKIEKFDYILVDTSQVPIGLFDPGAEQNPLSLFSILTGRTLGSGEDRTDFSEFISVKQESLSVLSNIVLLGERLYSAGITVEAMKCFTHIVTNSSDNYFRCQAYNNIGVIAHGMNDMKRAEQMFLSAIEIDSKNIDALLNLSDVYLTLGHHDNALNVLKKAFAAHPGNDRISERLALVTTVSNPEETVLTSDTQKAMEPDINDVSLQSTPEEKSDPIVFAPESLKLEIRRLHIGGEQRVDGWEIINAVDAPYVDHLGNAADLSIFADGTFESLYSSHVLEHFDYIELEKVLREWKRVLVPGGKIYVSVPNLDTITALLTKRKKSDLEGQFHLMRMIFGGHIDKYDYHYIGLNQTILSHFLHAAGFVDIQKVNNFGLFTDTSHLKFDGVAISLNMTAIKPKD